MPDLVGCDGSEKRRWVYTGIAAHALTAVPEYVAVLAGAIYAEKHATPNTVSVAPNGSGTMRTTNCAGTSDWRQPSSVFLMPAEQSVHRVSMPAFRRITAACCSPAAMVRGEQPLLVIDKDCDCRCA